MSERLSDEDVARVVAGARKANLPNVELLAREVQERRAAEEAKPCPQCEENAAWTRLGQAWYAQYEANTDGEAHPGDDAVVRWENARDHFTAVLAAVRDAKGGAE